MRLKPLFPAPFPSQNSTKKEIADFATSWFYELLTRLELVTSSLPRKCSTTELQQRSPWKSAVSRSTKKKFQHGVQHCVQQLLPAIACRLTIKWFMDSELCEKKERTNFAKGTINIPLSQSLSLLSRQKIGEKFSPPAAFPFLSVFSSFDFYK